MTVRDVSNDRYHVKIRFVSRNTHGTLKHWQWRSHTGGPNTQRTWTTTASDASGLFDAGIQAATFDGNTLRSSCYAWAGF
ncbi:hypothetical protein ACWEFL_26435 [Streptomyces sp. NPDC004838]